MTRKCLVCGGRQCLRPPAWECDRCRIVTVARCGTECEHSTDANPDNARWCRLIDRLVTIGEECKAIA